MRRKRKVFYSVTGFGRTMWDNQRKQWIHMEDKDYGRNVHEGYSSHRRCTTLKSALRTCRSLDKVSDPGEDIVLMRFTFKGGRRRIDEFTFHRRERVGNE